MNRRALVRPPGQSFARAISSTAAAIDVTLAQEQHAVYCQALRAAGIEVELLAPDERFPDSCFMQDPAMVIDGVAIICRPAAVTRQGEEETLVPILEARYPTVRIVPPGTLEGGDVLVLPNRIYVGLSARTNAAGVEQLEGILPRRRVSGIEVEGLLHLLSGVTHLGEGILLAVGELAERSEFRSHNVLRVPDEEAYACNALGLDNFVILPAGYPRTAALLRGEGFEVLEVPVSEFAKSDGGVTCLSLLC